MQNTDEVLNLEGNRVETLLACMKAVGADQLFGHELIRSMSQ